MLVLGENAIQEDCRRLAQPVDQPTQFEKDLCVPLYTLHTTQPPAPEGKAAIQEDLNTLVALFDQKKNTLTNDVVLALREKFREASALLKTGSTVASFVAKKRGAALPPANTRTQKQPRFDAARKKKSMKRARKVLLQRQQAKAIMGDY